MKKGLIFTITIITVVLVIGLAAFLTAKLLTDNPKKELVNSPKSVSNSPKPTKDKGVSLQLVATGDNLIHNSVYEQAKRDSSDGTYDFSKIYKYIPKLIKGSDLLFTNQETLMAPSLPPSNYPYFNTPSELGDLLVDMGYNLVNRCNNHIFDFGEKGFIEDYNFWASKKGVITGGNYLNQEDADKIRIIEKKGIKTSFLSYTWSTNGIPVPAGSDIRCIYLDEKDAMLKQIKSARKQSDVVIVQAHWGTEDSDIVNDEQRELAKWYIENGVDIILGLHPHVLQEIEMIKAGSREGVVIYSLGNLVSSQHGAYNQPGGVFKLNFTIKDKKIIYDKIGFIPTVNYYSRSYTDYQIIPFNMFTEEMANSHGSRNDDSRFSYQMCKDFFNRIYGKYLIKQ